jgi:hypothetical protein
MPDAVAQHWIEILAGLAFAWLVREVLPAYYRVKAGKSAMPSLRTSGSNPRAEAPAPSLSHAETLKVLAWMQEQQKAEEDAKPATRRDIRELRTTLQSEGTQVRALLEVHTRDDEARFADISAKLDDLAGEAAQ